MKPLAATLDRLYDQSVERQEAKEPAWPPFDGHTCRRPGCLKPPRTGRRKHLPAHRPYEGYETCSPRCAAEFGFLIKHELEAHSTPIQMWRDWGRWLGLEMDLTREEFIRHQRIHRIVRQQAYVKGEPPHASLSE